MAHFLLKTLRPAGLPWQRRRVLLGLASFALPLLGFASQDRLPQAALFGLGVFLALVMDNGSSRLQRVEHMLVGVLAVLLGALAGYAASSISPLLWWLGLLVGFVALGAAFNAGVVLEMQLRNLGLGYLIGRLPMLVPPSLLPFAAYGALWAMSLSALLLPATHNPFPLPAAPFWRADWHAGRAGRFAGLGFGLLLAAAVGCSMALALGFKLLSPAVAGTSTLFVLRPDHGRTLVLLWQRLSGALAAALLALLIFHLAPSPLLCALIAAACLAALPLVFASGVPWMVFNSALLIFMLLGMLGVAGSGAVFSVEFRVLDTVLGCAVAGVAGLIYRLMARQLD